MTTHTIEAVARLLRAVTEKGADDSVLPMLADALDEAHPSGRDPRAMIIRQHLFNPVSPAAHNHNTPVPNEVRHVETLHHHTDNDGVNHPGYHILETRLYPTDKGPQYMLYIGRFRDNGDSRFFYVRPPHAAARDIADAFPNDPAFPDATDFHTLLDRHYGPDPRNADKYAAALVAAIKPPDKSI